MIHALEISLFFVKNNLDNLLNYKGTTLKLSL